MELTPRDAEHVDQINVALKDFYLNGSSIVTEDNREGFMQVRFRHHFPVPSVPACPMFKSIFLIIF